ncbi:MAG: hypothetical protein IIB62_11130 [Proteobacteria bacterium]|nr:hypothetical protein [Pseudomonadota bacterium]
MRRAHVLIVCFLLVLTGLGGPAAAKRVALVIGNDAYEQVDKLQKERRSTTLAPSARRWKTSALASCVRKMSRAAR